MIKLTLCSRREFCYLWGAKNETKFDFVDPGLKYIFPLNTLLKQVHFLSWLCTFLKTHIVFIERLPGHPSVVFVLQTCSSTQVLPVRGARSQQYFIMKSLLQVIFIVMTCQF